MSIYTEDLLMRGITAARSGEKEAARNLLERSLGLDPDLRQRAEAWLWLSEVSDSPVEVRNCLGECLAVDPFNARARRKLAILDGKLDPTAVIDADKALEQLPAPPATADPQRFVCPNCGGRMTYSPDGQSLVCESCASRERLKAQHPDRAKASGASQDFFIAMATTAGHARPAAVQTLTCQGCGANFFLPPESLSQTCPYCSAVYVLERSEDREMITPTGLIPFKIDLERVRETLGKKYPHLIQAASSPKGLYLPAWSFNLGGRSTWTCLRYQNRQWLPDSGEEFVLENDILVAAGDKLRKIFPLTLTGFDLADLTAYDPRYLADWPAETYQITLADASLNARQQTVTRLRQKIEDGFFSQTKDLVVRATDLAVDSFKLILLPFWMAAPGNGDQTAVWINGQSGRFLTAPGSGSLGGWLNRLLGD